MTLSSLFLSFPIFILINCCHSSLSQLLAYYYLISCSFLKLLLKGKQLNPIQPKLQVACLTLGTCFTNWNMMVIWSFFRAKEIVNLPVGSRGFPRSLFSIIQWCFVWTLVAKLSQVRVLSEENDFEKCACSEFMCCSWYFLCRCSNLLRLPGRPRLPPLLRRRKHPHSSPLRIMCQ